VWLGINTNKNMISTKRMSQKTSKSESSALFNRVFIAPVQLDLADPQTGGGTMERLLLGVHEGTGLVAGFQTASAGADTARLLFCTKNCLLPKRALLERLHLGGEWPVHGLFDAFNVPSSLVGDLEPMLFRLFNNYHIKLEIRSDQAPLPEATEATLLHVAGRMEEAFCLDEREIRDYPMITADICRRAAQHAFSYRPGRGFLEHIAWPPEWNRYRLAHPLQPVDEYLEDHIRRDFDQVAGACFTCQNPGPQ
jgi:hypothetical protein